MKIIKNYAALLLTFFGVVTTASCLNLSSHKSNNSSIEHQKTHKTFLKKENAVTKLSKNGLYKLSLYSNRSAIPIGKIHDWIIHIEKPDGTLVENAKVFVFGGMPMHRHDFPTVPRVKENLGNGDYRVEGIKFSMRGHWEMRFTVKENNKQDKVTFEINL